MPISKKIFASAFQARIQPRPVVRQWTEYDKNSMVFALSDKSDFLTSNIQHQQKERVRKQPSEFTVQISFEGRACSIQMRSNETILAAMERTGAADLLSLPSVPFDCRRGNCLTCTGRHAENSRTSSIELGDDGLSPHMSHEVRKRGYILTCSSHVVGDGVSLELGLNSDAWTDVYKRRLEEEPIPSIGREAMAREIRRSDEKNLRRWAAETESALKKSDN